MKHLEIRVTGKVQGVYFRANTREVADNLGVKGYVQNQADGSVLIEAEGEEAAIQQFIEWCKKGPVRARVDHVSVKEGHLTGYTGFEVRR